MERKETNRNTHESIIAVIQWLSMNSKYSMCARVLVNWEFNERDFGRVSRRNTATYRRVWEPQAPSGLHHHIDGVDVFPRQRGSCSVHGKDARVYVMFTGNIHVISMSFLKNISWYWFLNMVFELSKSAQGNTRKLFHKHRVLEQVATLLKQDLG